MKRGLVLGKFMPLHTGHVSLIEYASLHCDELIVLICASNNEVIDGQTRLTWVKETFGNNEKIRPQLLEYDDNVLPNSSESSEIISRLWAEYLKENLPRIDVIFSSERYGDYLAEFLNCKSVIVDERRETVPISSTRIRNNPFKYWDFIPTAVKPYFVKKICIYGSESTGKTTLTKRLADFYKTACVAEMARDIIEETEECTPQNFLEIAALHAATINEKIKDADKLLFVDTDLNITRSYSRFLFGEQLLVPEWIEQANRFDAYLYLNIDAEFVQDGTRLPKAQRDLLNESHKRELEEQGISYHLVSGNWEERFAKAISIINALL